MLVLLFLRSRSERENVREIGPQRPHGERGWKVGGRGRFHGGSSEHCCARFEFAPFSKKGLGSSFPAEAEIKVIAMDTELTGRCDQTRKPNPALTFLLTRISMGIA